MTLPVAGVFVVIVKRRHIAPANQLLAQKSFKHFQFSANFAGQRFDQRLGQNQPLAFAIVDQGILGLGWTAANWLLGSVQGVVVQTSSDVSGSPFLSLTSGKRT